MTGEVQPLIGGRTALVGLLGWPVAHSRSPAMQNAAARALGLDLRYVPLPVHPEDLGEAVRGLAALGFRGANVTVPHKQTVMAFLDELDPVAAVIGAVNTIVIQRDEDGLGPAWLRGYNTDGSGFLADLAGLDFEAAGKHCLVLGAGGSARAVAYALARAGGQVRVFARRPEQGEALVKDLSAHTGPGRLVARPWTDLPEVCRQLQEVAAGDPTLIVNTTPVGMSPRDDQSPWPIKAPFPSGALVYDLIYNPAETRLMRQAQAAGCRTANGLGMLVHQGAEGFFLWTRLRADTSIMRQAIDA